MRVYLADTGAHGSDFDKGSKWWAPAPDIRTTLAADLGPLGRHPHAPLARRSYATEAPLESHTHTNTPQQAGSEDHKSKAHIDIRKVLANITNARRSHIRKHPHTSLVHAPVKVRSNEIAVMCRSPRGPVSFPRWDKTTLNWPHAQIGQIQLGRTHTTMVEFHRHLVEQHSSFALVKPHVVESNPNIPTKSRTYRSRHHK